MRVAVFSTKPHDEVFLDEANGTHELRFLEARLTPETVRLAEGAEAVCAFVNDDLGAEVIAGLAEAGVRLIALRSAGFNHVDLEAAAAAGLTVARVPAYSPHAVAEHAVALVLTLNRHIHRAYNRVREGNFALDGLMGMDLHGKTVGVSAPGSSAASSRGSWRASVANCWRTTPTRTPTVRRWASTTSRWTSCCGEATSSPCNAR